MQGKKLKIAILTNETSWMVEFDKLLADRLKKAGHDVAVVISREELPVGDIAFFLSCFEIIKGEYLERNRHNIVVHASELPQGKGWSPTTWQILEGKNDIPVTLFEAVEAVDAGDVYIRDAVHLVGNELINEWQSKLGMKIVEMCCSFVEMLEDNLLVGAQQTGEITFYARRTPADSEIDINKTIAEQFNLLRVVDNEKYPAFFNYGGRKYVLKVYANDNAQ